MKKIVSYSLVSLILFLIWQAISAYLSLPVLPSPISVLQNFPHLLCGELTVHFFYSFWRLAAGLFASLAFGIPVGIFMGYSRQADKILSPFLYLTHPVPKVALIPIIMLLFGIGDMPKIFLVFLIAFFQIAISVRDGVRAIPAEMLAPLKSLGASPIVISRHILLPSAVPNIVTAFKIALAASVSALFFAETFGTEYGIGFFVMDSWLRVNYLDMYSAVTAVSAVFAALFMLIDSIGSRLCRWNKKS